METISQRSEERDDVVGILFAQGRWVIRKPTKGRVHFYIPPIFKRQIVELVRIRVSLRIECNSFPESVNDSIVKEGLTCGNIP